MTEQPTPHRRGRPPLPPAMTKKKRNLRLGTVYDEAEKLAEALGMKVTAYVEKALERENARRRRELKR